MDDEREVYFSLYCHQCKDEKTNDTDDPCNECLAHPFNINSHKPLYFKEKED